MSYSHFQTLISVSLVSCNAINTFHVLSGNRISQIPGSLVINMNHVDVCINIVSRQLSNLRM